MAKQQNKRIDPLALSILVILLLFHFHPKLKSQDIMKNVGVDRAKARARPDITGFYNIHFVNSAGR